MARVRRVTETLDGLTAYKVRIKRLLKASEKVQLILQKGLIYTIPGTCESELESRTSYVITGNVEASKPWTNICHFVKPWKSLSPKMKKGFRLLYQSGCDCPIMSCHFWQSCPKASFFCAWETSTEMDDCQGRHAVCLRGPDGTCGWLG
ncbi:Metalloproteinase inhibitor 3 [Penaeus vannamei]|uniref:Metalloproteinase inhibitor 3 n=2 Tax=Penaeus vannamei TaxID=6689 RepID=A0A3R7PHW6_PENVA|nr:Metalloproteinase inhibitor 3 [Penaeus vannamei]